VHNSFFIINKISGYLSEKLPGMQVSECFSQQKDELILVFSASSNPGFTIRADMNSSFTCLSFPENFERSRKNNIDLFQAMIGRKVVKIIQYPFERLFHILLEDDIILLFKMFGNQSNILLYQNGECQGVFKNNLKKDKSFQISQYEPNPDLSYERFLALNADPKKFIPAFDKDIIGYLEARGYRSMENEEKFNLLTTILKELESAHTFYITSKPVLPEITLIKPHGSFKSFQDITEAMNFFYKERIYAKKFEEEKTGAIKKISLELEKTKQYADQCRKKLASLGNDENYSQMGDIIMANLNDIQPGKSQAELNNFYTGDMIIIPLKKGISPQKNAENYYRKSKNQKIEIDKLKDNLRRKELHAVILEDSLGAIKKAVNLKDLRAILNQPGSGKETGKAKNTSPFRVFNHLGYEILIGKNSRNNEELTFKSGSKNDMWLHARDVPGSHVIIRNKPGHKIPAPVIQKAAELAGYFSKNRNNTMCPVIYTERKYVRKLKGGTAGQVIVEREKVIFVEPGGVK
jgi:predicted ribosome quality control (RQC) complex YloA/Tae2 family protein